MKCIYCNFEHAEPFQFCPHCGADNRYSAPVSVAPVSVAPVNVAAERILPALKDNLFLAICILISISTGFSLISGSISVINILLTIFLWLTYSKGRKNIVDSNHLKSISGTVFASYVINFVLYGLVIFLGIIFALIFVLASANTELNEAFMEGFAEGLRISGMSPYEFEAMMGDIGMGFESFTSVIGWVFFLVFTIVGTVGIIINALSLGKIHRLAKSTYKSVESGFLALNKVNAAKNWLIVLGVFSAISALSTLASGEFLATVAAGSDAAASIIAGVLINKKLISAR